MSDYWDIATTLLTPTMPSLSWGEKFKIGQRTLSATSQSLKDPNTSVGWGLLTVVSNIACDYLYAPRLFFMPLQLYSTTKNLAVSVYNTTWFTTQIPNPTSAAVNSGKLSLFKQAFGKNECLFWDKEAKNLTRWERNTFKQVSQITDCTTMSRWLHSGATPENIASLKSAMQKSGSWWASDDKALSQMLDKIANLPGSSKSSYMSERWRCKPYLKQAQQKAGVHDRLYASAPTTREIKQHQWNAATGLVSAAFGATLTYATGFGSVSQLLLKKVGSQENFSQLFMGTNANSALEMCGAQTGEQVAQVSGLISSIGNWTVWGAGQTVKYFTPIMFGQQILGELNQGGWGWVAGSIHNYMFRAALHDSCAYTENQILPESATSWLGETSQYFGLFTGSDAATAGLFILALPWVAINTYKVGQAIFGNRRKKEEVKHSIGFNLLSMLPLAGASASATNYLRPGLNFGKDILDQGATCAGLNLPWPDAGICLAK